MVSACLLDNLKDTVSVGANGSGHEIGHGSVLIAAITSCTNTSNPSVMIAAGLLAKKAFERGLKIKSSVKTSLAPGSRVVTDYLVETGLQRYFDELGFHLVGYGCTTCIGNSGPLAPEIKSAIDQGNLVAASVLSGNRNFEARVHSAIKANFLMSPPLVVAYALAGTVDVNLDEDSLGSDSSGNPVYLRDLWPSTEEVDACVAKLDSSHPCSRRDMVLLTMPIPNGTKLKLRRDPYLRGMKKARIFRIRLFSRHLASIFPPSNLLPI